MRGGPFLHWAQMCACAVVGLARIRLEAARSPLFGDAIHIFFMQLVKGFNCCCCFTVRNGYHNSSLYYLEGNLGILILYVWCACGKGSTVAAVKTRSRMGGSASWSSLPARCWVSLQSGTCADNSVSDSCFQHFSTSYHNLLCLAVTKVLVCKGSSFYLSSDRLSEQWSYKMSFYFEVFWVTLSRLVLRIRVSLQSICYTLVSTAAWNTK